MDKQQIEVTLSRDLGLFDVTILVKRGQGPIRSFLRETLLAPATSNKRWPDSRRRSLPLGDLPKQQRS